MCPSAKGAADTCTWVGTPAAHGVYTMGIYYDNPHEVPDELCRYAVGVLVKDPSEEAANAFQEHGYSRKPLPATAAAVTTFPFTGIISIVLGVMRVYPALVPLPRPFPSALSPPHLRVLAQPPRPQPHPHPVSHPAHSLLPAPAAPKHKRTQIVPQREHH